MNGKRYLKQKRLTRNTLLLIIGPKNIKNKLATMTMNVGLTIVILNSINACLSGSPTRNALEMMCVSSTFAILICHYASNQRMVIVTTTANVKQIDSMEVCVSQRWKNIFHAIVIKTVAQVSLVRQIFSTTAKGALSLVQN